MATISASSLVGLMAYDGDSFESPFVVTEPNLKGYQACEEPEDGWVMLWQQYEKGVDGLYKIIH